ncbi:Sec-independent protein translocase protein TatA [Sporomusaceae bacterium FL31]|nr:Sec-independent protein translocase protein TatA [Sporomusaceae bacterium FL31]GCE35029.1 Sec-independent protein translocase protein TatA [Sporomusaceae bacterium]
MFNLAIQELVLILIIALVVFGPGKLPEVGKALGRSIREFKNSTNQIKEDVEKAAKIDNDKS